MTGESMMNLETLEAEEETEFEAVESESLEDTLLKSIQEVSDNVSKDAKTDEGQTGAAHEEAKKSDFDTSEAARILAKSKSKKQGRRQTIEASELQPAAQLQKAPDKPLEERFDAPQRWDVASKEEFNKLPSVAKKQVLSFWNGIESHTTKLWQDLNREKEQVSELNRVIKHYAPQWHQRGLSEVQAIAEFAALDQRMTQDRVGTCAYILQRAGVTPEMIAQHGQSGSAGTQQIAQSSQPPLTKDEVVALFRQEQQNFFAQQSQQAGLHDLKQLQNQIDAGGRYIYPELHDPGQIERVKPLVEALQKTQPHLAIAEATKQAINALRVLDGKIGSPSLPQPRLSQENEIEKVRNASVSVRPRGNGVIPTTTKAKAGESLEESIMRSIASLTSSH